MSSVNQTAKAIATARGIMASKAKDLYCAIGFSETEIDGEQRTLMVFRIIVR